MGKLQPLIEKLHENRILTAPEYVELLEQRNPEDTEFMRKLAQEEARHEQTVKDINAKYGKQ